MFLLRVHDLLLCYLYLFAHTGVQHKVIDEEGTTSHYGVLLPHLLFSVHCFVEHCIACRS